jgi:hypothetical protein
VCEELKQQKYLVTVAPKVGQMKGGFGLCFEWFLFSLCGDFGVTTPLCA